MSNEIKVVLVDENDNEIGTKGKIDAHLNGDLHRAVSVLIFSSDNKWLLQKRADTKYHSPGLWSNTCCTHPEKDESHIKASNRRLEEEMGMNAPLKQIYKFQYRAELEKGMIENEVDTVFMGISDDSPILNPDEVNDFRYITTEELKKEIHDFPENFTPWFIKLFTQVEKIISHKEI